MITSLIYLWAWVYVLGAVAGVLLAILLGVEVALLIYKLTSSVAARRSV